MFLDILLLFGIQVYIVDLSLLTLLLLLLLLLVDSFGVHTATSLERRMMISLQIDCGIFVCHPPHEIHLPMHTERERIILMISQHFMHEFSSTS
jgi:hypothetical protein